MKVNGKMINFKDLEYFIQMEIDMKVNLKIANLKDMEE